MLPVIAALVSRRLRYVRLSSGLRSVCNLRLCMYTGYIARLRSHNAARGACYESSTARIKLMGVKDDTGAGHSTRLVR